MHLSKSFFPVVLFITAIWATSTAQTGPDYQKLKVAFESPDHATWGEVPLWWWEADSLNKERVTWQLETLAAKGVKALCPIQRSPARCYPESFSEEWWRMVEYVHGECERLGMHLWLYDQVGYGHYGWLEKAASRVGNTGTYRIEFHSSTAKPGESFRMQLTEGKVLDARAFPVMNDTARDEKSLNIKKHIHEGILSWDPPEKGEWKVAVSVAAPYRSFYLNEASADAFLQQFYQGIEQVVGPQAMGKSLAGVFQDEHPPTPRNIYNQALADTFRTMFGYNIARAIPALHFDVGSQTPKYRTDYFDAYLALVEKTYWKKVFDWTGRKNLLTSHDNWGRKNIYNHSQGYIDYFRSQRWFSAPGFDDAGQHPVTGRNYYDTKIAASIARLYNRPRVWNEGFHSSGWGRTTNQTLSWLAATYAFGANLYDEHGLYYSLNASTWEHAAPDPHWNQPYWRYYHKISDWVARASYLMSQGKTIADVAVHYPVTSLLADQEKNDIDYNTYMQLSRLIYNEGMDNDIIDDQSIAEGHIQGGTLSVRGNQYQALVFGPQKTMRLSVAQKALDLVQSGGVVIFYGQLPQASAENGRADPRLARLLEEMLETLPPRGEISQTTVKHEKDGYAAFIPETPALIPDLLSANIDRDFVGKGGDVFVAHRKTNDTHIYLIQNTGKDPVHLEARLRADGVPEKWDPFSGTIRELDHFERKNGYTFIRLLLEGTVGQMVVLNPGKPTMKKDAKTSRHWYNKPLSENWDFSVIPTRDNRWGDFRWPPSDEKLGPEVRQMKYREEEETKGVKKGWHRPGFNDHAWEKVTFDRGPYWLALEEIPEDAAVIPVLLQDQEKIAAGEVMNLEGTNYSWREITFSQKTGAGTPAPWGGHSGYPDGHYNKNFIQLKEGRKLLFTHIVSPKKQRAGLKVQLRNQEPRLWVNGKQEKFSGAVGNLPLEKGYNRVLLDIPDGSGGMVYVQKEAPAVGSSAKTQALYQPDLSKASWIWAGNSEGAYFRKTIELEEVPEKAQVLVTGVSGFRLFINGQKVEEDIGPWASWEYPKSVDVTPFLKKGQNLIAAWGQFLKGMHVAYADNYKGFILAMKGTFETGGTFELHTDASWKGNPKETKNWQMPETDASGWQPASVRGEAGENPWGGDFLKNAGSSTTPHRPLSVNLSSPLLNVFEEMPGITYDVKNPGENRTGWYRFEAPPGLKEMSLPQNEAQVWVNGEKISTDQRVAVLKNPPVNVSTVAVRIPMKPGRYKGAAFEKPVEMKLQGGKIQEGPWAGFALPTYSGIGVYKQQVELSNEEITRQVILDLGTVHVAAEVFVNGKPAGIRVASPFKFNISSLVREGANEIEVHVANTLAPHYSFPRRAMNLGPVRSGLTGPVTLKIAAP